MLHKNLPGNERWWKLPARIVLNIIAGLKEWFAGDRGYLKAVWKGCRDYLKWSKKHQQVKGEYPRYDGVYNGLIVWDYFIKGKKRFLEIVKDK